VVLLNTGEPNLGERWPTEIKSSCIVPPIRPGIDARRFRIARHAPWPAASMLTSAGLIIELSMDMRPKSEQEDRAPRAVLIVRQVRSTSCVI
jgi:hypothetical protein